MLTFDEAAEHPHNAQRELYRVVDGVLHPSPAPRLSGTPAREPSSPPPGTRALAEVLAEWKPGETEGAG